MMQRPSFYSSTGLPNKAEDISLRKDPILTLHYFWASLCHALPSSSLFLFNTKQSVSLILFFGLLWMIQEEARSGTFGTHFLSLLLWLENSVLESMFWLGCGILSTIGLGSGLQTGVLFLFPHVCREALLWSQSSNNNLSVLLWRMAIPGFWSGTGSAIGETVPFFLARAIKNSGGDPFSLISSTGEETGGKNSFWKPRVLLSNTRSAMEHQLENNAFLKIFILAIIPNALFDLAGLICGSSGVSFWIFFSAVWSAKALVRTPMQTCTLAAAVTMISLPPKVDDNAVVNGIVSMISRWGRSAIAQYIDNHDDDDDVNNKATSRTLLLSLTKNLWVALTVILFGFFVVSTIDQVAQQHFRSMKQSKKKKGKHHNLDEIQGPIRRG
mmetsp:Transcript_9065/g.10001  ORF Transcript_9065/g.10001 Transcript_9065/m.10001 type:complete len:384 (-) Transcript_9065:268-1419(-)